MAAEPLGCRDGRSEVSHEEALARVRRPFLARRFHVVRRGAGQAGGGEGEREFGDQGILAIGAATGLDFGYTSTSNPNGQASTNNTHFSISPDIQYFVIDSLSVGGTVLFDWQNPNQGGSSTTFGIGPTVGYNIWIQPGFLGVWPQATFSFDTTSFHQTATNGTTTSASDNSTNVGVYVPLLIHPVKHFHFGIGPYFNIDLSNSGSQSGVSADGPKSTNVGLKADIAGWL